MNKKDRNLLASLEGEIPDAPASSTYASTITPSSKIDAATASSDEMLSRAEEIVSAKQLTYNPDEVADVGVQEIAVAADDIFKAAKESLDFLSALLMPLIHEFDFPIVFQAVWKWLTELANNPRTFPQLALGLPRGFGKTTLIKIFICYCILFTDKKFILIIGATAKLAENILSDVIDMLNEPNIKRVFGDWSLGVEKDTQDLKKFGYRGKNIILAAIGEGGSLRGLNLKNLRPDVEIFEDVQTRECADSKIQSDNLENWMVGTAMKAKSPKGCMFLFVGNMYPTEYSILRKLKSNPKWTKFIAGGILEDGTSLWEELQPIAQLISEFENDLSMGKPEIFYAEVLNDENAATNNLLDVSALKMPAIEEGDIPAGKFIMIDPSNDKKISDNTAIGYFEIHNATPILMDVVDKQMSPGETIKQALKFGLQYQCRLIVIESNAYQYSLLYWCDFICEQLGVEGFHFEPIYSGTRNKNSRIIDMFLSIRANELYLHPNTRPFVVPQALAFNPLKNTNKDDVLDLLTYALRIVSELEGLILSLTVVEIQEFDTIEVIEHNSPI